MKTSFSAFLFVLLAILITLGEQGVAAGRWWYSSYPPPPSHNGWVWQWPWPVYSYPPPPAAVKPPSDHGPKSPPLSTPPQSPMVDGKCLGVTLESKLTCLQDVIRSIMMFRPYVSPECCTAVQATHENCLNTIFDEFNNPFLAPLVQQQCFQTPNPNPNPKPHGHHKHHHHGHHHNHHRDHP